MNKPEKETPKNANIAQQIFEDLQRQILSGQLGPGERLLGERELAAKYGTNRNTLREAVRKLEQARLVSVRHGRGVTVADFRRTGTPELLSPYLQAGPDLSEVAEIIGDVLEPRILLLEYAARLAVRRAEPADVERLSDIGDLLIAAFEAGDAAVVARGFQRWLDVMVEAGHSVSVRWIANSLFEALRDTLERFPNLWVLEPTFPAYLNGLVNALRTGDESGAASITRAYYERVDQKLMELLRALAGAAPDAEGDSETGLQRPVPNSDVVPSESRGSEGFHVDPRRNVEAGRGMEVNRSNVEAGRGMEVNRSNVEAGRGMEVNRSNVEAGRGVERPAETSRRAEASRNGSGDGGFSPSAHEGHAVPGHQN